MRIARSADTKHRRQPTQADRVYNTVVLAHQSGRASDVAIGADAAHFNMLAKYRGRKLIIALRRAQTDADDTFHQALHARFAALERI